MMHYEHQVHLMFKYKPPPVPELLVEKLHFGVLQQPPASFTNLHPCGRLE